MYTYPTATSLYAYSQVVLVMEGLLQRGKTVRPPGSRSSNRVPIKPRTTSDQPSTVSGRGKSTGQKRKKGKDPAPIDDAEEQVPEHNTTTVHIAAWRRLRDANPYRFKERTSTADEGLFWTETQGCLWERSEERRVGKECRL